LSGTGKTEKLNEQIDMKSKRSSSGNWNISAEREMKVELKESISIVGSKSK